jgi:hypothetical protein
MPGRCLIEYQRILGKSGFVIVDLARKFDLTPAAVSCAVQRGGKMAKEKDYQLETGDI